MAGDWIKMRTDLLTSPKVVRISSALKADRFRTVGGLLSVWSLFDSHSTDGQLSGYSPETLDELAAWSGFSQAMIDVGWLLYDGESLELPRFEAHNGASAKRRAQDADRKKSVRNLSASEADKKRTREEKRREENIKDKSSRNSDEPNDQKTEQPRIPYQQIRELYAKHLPMLPQVKIFDEARKALIRSRWNADPRFQSIEFWEKFFIHVSKSNFLTGQGDSSWRSSFDWILKPANFKKIVEGNYSHE